MDPAELHDPLRYRCLLEIDHAAVAATLQPWIWRRSRVAALYLLANLVAAAVVAVTWARSGLGLAAGFSVLSTGMCAGFLALLPIHEGCHALAYRQLGARAVKVRYSLRTLTAFCLADRFVVTGRQLARVALAPTVLLNPPLLVSAGLAPGGYGLALAGALLLHVGAASGDFALLNWLALHGGRQVLSYDDEAARRSFFFVPCGGAAEPLPAGAPQA